MSKPVESGPAPKKREMNPFANMAYIDESNRRRNKNFELYRDYQVNPYTKRTLDFVTPKVNERAPKICPEDVPGYEVIKNAIWKAYAGPMQRFFEPQTEGHRLGWFDKGKGYFDRENYDARFTFSHRTADFIATQAALREYDRLMGAFTKKGPPPPPQNKGKARK